VDRRSGRILQNAGTHSTVLESVYDDACIQRRNCFGDLIAALLALIAIPAVAMDWKSARLLVWIFTVEGTLDLMAAIALATIYGAHEFMGPAYWIPAFWVPALLVTHYITFVVLLKYWRGSA
jgi:hypothetical protein